MSCTASCFPDRDSEITLRRLDDGQTTLAVAEVTLFLDLPFVLRLRDALNAFVGDVFSEAVEDAGGVAVQPPEDVWAASDEPL